MKEQVNDIQAAPGISGKQFRKLLSFEFDSRLFAALFAGFILAVVTGTLSHECGHYLAAKALGHDARIAYNHTRWPHEKTVQHHDKIIQPFMPELKSGRPFPGSEEYFAFTRRLQNDEWKISLGGPLQTMLTGTSGLLLLFAFRKKFIHARKLSPALWVLVFISLFWLRQAANLGVSLIYSSIGAKAIHHGDEISLAQHFSWSPLSILVPTGLLAIAIALLVIFRFIPVSQRFTFMLAGLSGGPVGYYLWMVVLGPRLLP